MSRAQSRMPLERQMSHLEKKHAELSQRVALLDSKFYLTPSEKRELRLLKKQKLKTKDDLVAVNRDWH